MCSFLRFFSFLFTDPSTTDIYTLSLHDALPIAIAFALGPKLGGIFGDDTLMEKMKKIGETNGDFVWPMPLVDEYDETLKSDYADFSNISSQSSGGSITAALFLRRFVPKSAKWIHVDMAGVMESKSKGYYGKSATGFGARLLADYAVKVSQN